jgi:hypothetical protein
MNPAIPQTYAQWRECIEVDCGIALTAPFIAARLAILTQPQQEETVRFARHYGTAHLARVVAWFQTAQREVARA